MLLLSAQPLRVYWYRDCLVRFATHKYDMKDINNQYAHLTNTSINKHSGASGVGGAHTYRLPSLLATRRGALLLFAHGRLASARDVGASAVFLSTSLDGGKTWTAALRVLSDPSNRTMIAQQAVLDQRQIARHYVLSRWFLLDFFSIGVSRIIIRTPYAGIEV